MKKKRWALILFFSCLFPLLFFVGCRMDGCGNACNESNTPDYAKYEYYGEYSFSGTFYDGSSLELDVTLETNGQYAMKLRLLSYGSGHYFIDEVGSYEMRTLDKPIKDETMEVIYFIDFNGTRSTGYDGDIVNTYYGSITENYLKNFTWSYCDIVDLGATILFNNDTVAYTMDYRKLSYDIVYTAETGGSISGASMQTVYRGENGYEVTAVPDYGYAFVQWSDGLISETRQETAVYNDIELTAEFIEALPKYTLTYQTTTGGSIEGETSQTMFEGLNGTAVRAVAFDRTAPNGDSVPYVFVGWSDGVSSAERTDLDVHSDLTVTAIFEPQYAYWAQTIEGGGNVSLSSSIANSANDYTVTATAIANDGWAFVEWSDGVTTESRTDVLTADKKVEAIFAKQIVLIAQTGGKITFNGETDTQITVLLRMPMAGEYNQFAQSVADSGYEAYGWSHYEDGSWLDSYNSYLTLDYDHSYSTYYAIFTRNEEADGDGTDTPSDGNDDESDETGVCNHTSFAIGDTCSVCDGECYVRKDTDLLMYYETDGALVAEFYGTEATNVFEVYASQITRIYLSDSVTVIAHNAFQRYNALTNVRMSNNLTEIQYDSFYGCTALTSITIPDSVTTIESQAFCGCYSLSDIQIGNHITKMGASSFNATAWYYAQPDNSILYLGNVCYGVKGILPINTTVEIAANTQTIADSAFGEQGGLRTVTLPESVTHIGEVAFYNCPALLNVNTGGSIQHVGRDAFSSTAFYDHKAFTDGVFYLDKVLVKANTALSGEYAVKEGTVEIADYAFYQCTVLTGVTLPDSVTVIGIHAFDDCNHLIKAELSNNLISIGEYAFYDCWDFNIIIPKSVQIVGDSAFTYNAYVYCEAEKMPDGWNDNWNASSPRVYWYSENEPALNEEQTAYNGNYWYYGDNGEIVVWTLESATE